MDIFRPFRRKKFLENLVVLFKKECKLQSENKGFTSFKNLIISFLTKNLEQYEKDVFGKTIVPIYWRKRFVEQAVDEQILQNDAFAESKINSFVFQLADHYDLVIEMWLDIENKLKGDD